MSALFLILIIITLCNQSTQTSGPVKPNMDCHANVYLSGNRDHSPPHRSHACISWLVSAASLMLLCHSFISCLAPSWLMMSRQCSHFNLTLFIETLSVTVALSYTTFHKWFITHYIVSVSRCSQCWAQRGLPEVSVEQTDPHQMVQF